MPFGTGTPWSHLDIDLPGTPQVVVIYVSGENLYIGYSDAGTASASYVNTITNSGSATAYPVIHLKRVGGTSMACYWFKNQTTGATIYMYYSFQDGEELTLDFRLLRHSVISSYYGSVIGRAIFYGSDFSGFNLRTGANSISMYLGSGGGATITAYITWTNTHLGADGVAA